MTIRNLYSYLAPAFVLLAASPAAAAEHLDQHQTNYSGETFHVDHYMPLAQIFTARISG